jgi:hypothetical protein
VTARPQPALLLITGSRQFNDHVTFRNALDHAWSEALGRGFNELVVVHGGAKGADALAQDWAERRQARGVHWRRFPAEWDGPCTAECAKDHRRPKRGGGTYCPAEGTRRNQRMIDHVRAQAVPGGVLALVFLVPELNDGRTRNRGTHDCWRRIKAAGLPYRNFTARQVQR